MATLSREAIAHTSGRNSIAPHLAQLFDSSPLASHATHVFPGGRRCGIVRPERVFPAHSLLTAQVTLTSPSRKLRQLEHSSGHPFPLKERCSRE